MVVVCNMLHQRTIEAAIFALGVTVALVLVNPAWRRSRFVALLVGLCVGHAVSLSVLSNGWREEANQLLNRELLIDTTLETFATRMFSMGWLLQSSFETSQNISSQTNTSTYSNQATEWR